MNNCKRYFSLIERKILMMGDSAESSLLGRLDQIDIRLRQLEEKQAVPESYFTADMRGRGKPVASIVDEVHLKDSLMNRLNLLETRISQLSDELDKGGSTGCGSSDVYSSSNTNMKEEGGITYPAEKQKLMKSNCSGRVSGGTWRAGADIFQSHRFEKKDPMQAATTEAVEKRTATFCRKEKKRMEHTRLYRRWFPVSC